MVGKIEVVNVSGMVSNKEGVVYCGREWKGWKSSVLGNPFHIGKDGNREEVIEKYKGWLRKEYSKGGSVKVMLDMLSKKYLKGEKIVLGCWCYPQSCHAEFVRDAIIGISKKMELDK